MPETSADQAAGGHGGDGRTVVVIGDGDLSEETERALEAAGAQVSRLCEPDERDVREALEGGVDSVAIVARADAVVLRMALMVRAVSDDVPLLLTIFDLTMAAEASRWSNTRVTSLADIVAPSLAGPCIDAGLTSVSVDEGRRVGLVEDGDGVREQPLPSYKPHRVQAFVRDLLTPYDESAAMLLYGALGLLVVFAVETATAAAVLDQSLVDAIYGSAKTLVTVDPNPKVSAGPGWYKLFTSVTMLIALIFAAGFTAGLVNRVIDRRLTGLFGDRAVPRRNHVVVVGLGQVGLRLCLLLRECKIPVVAVESEGEGENVGRAKELGLPVVLGRGTDQSLLCKLSLHRATAVAAVTANDVENISVAMTARSVQDDMHVVMRVGDGEIANETRSLLALGLVRDVHRIAASLLAAMALGRDAESVVCLEDEAHLRFADGRLERGEIDTLEGGSGG